jgi:hypothetical protein
VRVEGRDGKERKMEGKGRKGRGRREGEGSFNPQLFLDNSNTGKGNWNSKCKNLAWRVFDLLV